MEFHGSLQVIAEIGIGLAGFSGLIVALRKNAGPLTAVQKYRLQILLSLAFGAMFLSLLPELLFSFGSDPQDVWRLSSACLSIYSILFLIWWIRESLYIKDANPELFNWFAYSRMVAGHVVIILMQLSSVFSIFDFADDASYVVALIWYLLHSAQQFTRMLFVQPTMSDSSSD
ncbi:MAG: hypothetical protein OES26_20960 [Gammaproteobacteria bacterium]|nr:hypothetical protein [Gammaproteobacteria bacterium]